MKANKTFFVGLFSCLMLIACNQQPKAKENFSAEGYEITELGNGLQEAVKKDPASGQPLEEGLLLHGKKEGTWVTYHPNNDKLIPKSIQSYINGQPSGILIEYGNRGQLEKIAHYLNGQLHGRYATYDYGRLKEVRHYKHGQLDGLFSKYYPKTDKLQSTAEFKDGKQHGMYRYYDEEGNVTLEYEYQNGKKVRGGMKKK